jgi:hypothetical protein
MATEPRELGRVSWLGNSLLHRRAQSRGKESDGYKSFGSAALAPQAIGRRAGTRRAHPLNHRRSEDPAARQSEGTIYQAIG